MRRDGSHDAQMDNKELARFVKDELAKVISAVHALVTKIDSFGLKLGTPREQDETGIKPKADASDKGHDTPRTPLVVPPTPTDSSHPKTTANKGHPRRTFRRKVWRQTKRIFFKKDRLERIGLIAGIIYAAVTVIQWRDLQHNFAADQRSWLKLGYSYPSLATTSIWESGITITNVGKSPALHIALHAYVELIPNDSPPSFRMVGQHSWFSSALIFPTEGVAAPFRLLDSRGKARPLTDNEVARLIDGKAYLAVFGQVIYTDQFGAHWTRFCTWRDYSTIPTKMSASQCVEWNSVGNGDPPKTY
jgi:hypothetical protein